MRVFSNISIDINPGGVLERLAESGSGPEMRFFRLKVNEAFFLKGLVRARASLVEEEEVRRMGSFALFSLPSFA